MGKWYGSLQNRLEENRQYVPEIKVGTGVTEYMWSDRKAYEVTKVIDQKHVYIRQYRHVATGEPMSNEWKLVSDPDLPELYLTKRGKYWYRTSTWTREDLQKYIKSPEDRLHLVLSGFDPDVIEAKGKQTKYIRMNVSFGVADYHYDYSF